MTLKAEVTPGWTRCDAQEPDAREGPGLTHSGYSGDGLLHWQVGSLPLVPGGCHVWGRTESDTTEAT